MFCNPLRMGMISSRHDVLSRTSRTGGQSNRRWGSKAIRIGHSLEDSSLRTRKTALSAEILLGSPKTSRSFSERNSRKIRLRCIFRRTLVTPNSDDSGHSQADIVTTVFRKERGGSLKKPRKISQIPARVTPAKGAATPNIG